MKTTLVRFGQAFLFCLMLNPLMIHARKNDLVSTTAAKGSTLVQVAQGTLKGGTERGVYCWKGIPYAAAPVGPLRFKAPEPPLAWQGVREAVEFGPASPQVINQFVGDAPQSEDCLFLNVWSPGADGQKRPVMFWIHGGGFTVGAGSTNLYNGANLSRNGDVVVVTINYRLGVMGFLHFEEAIRKQLGYENNLGIRDQIAALKWVKENIAAFGGDPEQITIFGESAGGTSVETLLAAKAAKGLFKRAIVESGPPAIVWHPQTASQITGKYLELLGVSKDSIQQLSEIPLVKLKATEEVLLEHMVKNTQHKVFSPSIDGELLSNEISSCLRPEQSGSVELMIGTNKDEATLFARNSLKMVPQNAEQLEKEFLYAMKTEDKAAITAAYSNYPKKSGVYDLLCDAVFRIPAIRLAESQSTHAPVYMYRFDYTSFVLNLTGLKSFHGLEIPFVFGNADGALGKLLKFTASKKTVNKLTASMQTAWINFARYGNPNGTGKTQWKPYESTQRATMIFDKNPRLVYDPDGKQRKAWETVCYY